ncbi:hypothetical protein JZ751_023426 [Albula glossodonta]|uniref:receptor protein-tyrosine kinase n=1 Tax=Albula glossodonta TaxID=121402 RepID=A0A8T2MQI5_9TELE|nr:hypothetical protein JZ751_023426 [Albula glossodonta]
MGFKKLKSNSWALCLAILLSWSGSAPQPLAEESGGIQPARCFIGRKCGIWDTEEMNCSWGFSDLIISQVSEQDSGNYSLCCAFGGRWSCVVFAVQVTPQESRPSAPQLKIERGGKGSSSIYACSSDGFPKPTIQWITKQASLRLVPEENTLEHTAVSKVKSYTLYNKDVVCCAENPLGRECTRLNNYDLSYSHSANDVSKVTLTPGQPLLLRCVLQEDMVTEQVTYLFIESVREEHTGRYTCTSKDNRTRSTDVQVLKGGFMNVEGLNEVNSVTVQHRSQTVQLCDPVPGLYQFFAMNSKTCIIKNMSLCVIDTPRVSLSVKDDRFTCSTNSTPPFNITWHTCPPCPPMSAPCSCQDASSWNASVERPLQVWGNDGQCQRTGAASATQLERAAARTYPCRSMRARHGYESQLRVLQLVDNDYVYIDFKDLQYDQSWEFPRENLELGRELGSGAFGMVVEATAYGISKPGVSLQVAVKMLKEKHQMVDKEALMSELKMLMQIGNHVNIVNLLGACTGSGPIYLIFQYCAKGDLLNYLKTNRERFHQSLTDVFTKNRFSCLYHNFPTQDSLRNGPASFQSPYIPMFPAATRATGEREELLGLRVGLDQSEGQSDGTYEESELSRDDELQVLTYDDLLSFSFQVAKGMEFLSSKNCIHRDLAARNVLVTHNNTVKIGDFGLARDIENDSNYVVRGNVRLPVKWMAPESLFQGVYTMQSDVYQVMHLCWALQPSARPPFSKLVAFMEAELEHLEEKLYFNITGSTVYKNVPLTNVSQSEPCSFNCKTSAVTQATRCLWEQFCAVSIFRAQCEVIAVQSVQCEVIAVQSVQCEVIAVQSGAAEGCGGGVVHCFSELGGAVWWQHALDSELRGRGSVEGKQCRAVAEPCRAPAPQSFTSPASR